MKDEDVFAFIPILIIGIMWGFLLMGILCTYKFGKVEEENKELKIENHKLEQKLLKLYEEQQRETE